ncbi:MAG: hypothetical protein R2883_06180 [Caldisericia bacterium]
MEHKAEYDPIKNIQFFEFIGTPKSSEDVDFLIKKNREAFEKLTSRVWLVTNLASMSSASPALIAEFGQKSVPLVQKYGIEEFVHTHKSIQRLMIQIYNNISGSKVKVFKSREEAIEYVLERQKTVGVKVPF